MFYVMWKCAGVGALVGVYGGGLCLGVAVGVGAGEGVGMGGVCGLFSTPC